MTAPFITTMRQSLRKTWVRCVAGMCLFFSSYIAAGTAEWENSRSLPLKCFENRPDLILTEQLNSDQSVEDPVRKPFKVSIVDIRDEQDLPNSSPSIRDQGPVYTFRVARPELLLDESHIVQLQCSANSSEEDEKSRIFAALGDRIVCQKEFSRRDDHSKVWSFSLGFNR